MATFTDVFTISAVLRDGRTLTMKATTTYSVTKVMEATISDVFYGLTSVNQPQLDAEPVFTIYQYQGNGLGNVGLTNTAAGAASFNMRHNHSVQIHGTECFDTDTSAVTATVTAELSEIDITNSAPGGQVRITALM